MTRWLIDVVLVKLGPGLVTAAVVAAVTALVVAGLLDEEALHAALHDMLGVEPKL